MYNIMGQTRISDKFFFQANFNLQLLWIYCHRLTRHHLETEIATDNRNMHLKNNPFGIVKSACMWL